MNRDVIIHIVRHGHILSHESDVALTDEGWRTAYHAGREWAAIVEDGEQVTFLHGPARRARKTAQAMYQGFTEALAAAGRTAVQVTAPVQHPGLRNLGVMIDGRFQENMRLFYDAIRTAYQEDPSPENTERVAFHRGFWNSDDPMGYWLTHPSPYAEAPQQAAARIHDVLRQQLAEPPTPPARRRRVFCASHSGPMRAFLREVLGSDPGEPAFCESFTVEKEEDGVARVVFRDQRVELGEL
jgi:broad specificity phosphatase PhoE